MECKKFILITGGVGGNGWYGAALLVVLKLKKEGKLRIQANRAKIKKSEKTGSLFSQMTDFHHSGTYFAKKWCPVALVTRKRMPA